MGYESERGHTAKALGHGLIQGNPAYDDTASDKQVRSQGLLDVLNLQLSTHSSDLEVIRGQFTDCINKILGVAPDPSPNDKPTPFAREGTLGEIAGRLDVMGAHVRGLYDLLARLKTLA